MAERVGGALSKLTVKIEPQVEGADRASAQLNRLVDKGVAAVEAGNLELAEKYEHAVSRLIGKKGKAELRVDVDTVVDADGVKHLKKTSRIHTENISKLNKQRELHHGSLTSLRAQLRTATQKRDAIKATVTSTGLFGRQVQITNGHWREANEEVKKISAELQKVQSQSGGKGFMSGLLSMGNKLNQITMAAMALGQAIQAVNAIMAPLINRQKEIQSLKLSFEQLGVTLEGQEAILASAKAVSLTYGQSLTKIEGAYKRLGPAIMAAGGSLSDTQLVIETIAARTTMLGLNTEKTGRYIEAFAQVMGKGRLQGEELNQQFAELDGALRGQLASYMEAKFGITDLAQAMQDSEVTSQMFMEAMIAIGEVARNKVASDFVLLQNKIDSLGQKGGMTIAQLQAKMQTLTAIGLEKVGQTLAPIGKALASIYAAFVQIFTKVATEMPGVQALFNWLSKALGRTLKLAINGLLLLFGVLMEAVNTTVLGIMELVDAIKQIPILGDMVKGLEQWGEDIEKNLDYAIDGFSALDEATTGSLDAVAEYEAKVNDLSQQLLDGKITQDEYNQAIENLNTQQARAELKGLESQAEMTKAKLDAMMESYQAASQIKIEGYQEEISALEKAGQKEKELADEEIENIRRAADARKRGYEDSKAAVKDYYGEVKKGFDDQAERLKNYKEQLSRQYEDAKAAAKDYYQGLKDEENKRHAETISNLDAEIAKLKRRHEAEMGQLESGPEKEKLQRMELEQLKEKARSAETAFDRQKAKAQIEEIENEKKKANLEKVHAAQMEKAEQKKAEEEKRHAEEKKKIEEEERAAMRKFQDEQKQAFRDIADALKQIASDKKAAADAEKASVDSISAKKREDERDTKDAIQAIKDKQEEAAKERQKQIDAIKDKIEEEEDKVRDVTREIEANERAQSEFGDAIEDVTTGELEDQLQKLREIGRQIEANKRKAAGGGGGGGGQPQAFAGGPVTGGQKYTVNELGREGFITSSGKMQEIATRAWGTWRAPSNGTIIPAHLWSEIKANQQAATVTPGTINPGNATARAISNITNTAGAQYNNNVTIQSVNPVQDANRMMVEMTRLKRRRLGR